MRGARAWPAIAAVATLALVSMDAHAMFGGGAVPCGRPALPYTPVRSGLPSGIRRTPVGALAVVAGLALAGAVPSTVTTMLRDAPPFNVSV